MHSRKLEYTKMYMKRTTEPTSIVKCYYGIVDESLYDIYFNVHIQSKFMLYPCVVLMLNMRYL